MQTTALVQCVLAIIVVLMAVQSSYGCTRTTFGPPISATSTAASTTPTSPTTAVTAATTASPTTSSPSTSAPTTTPTTLVPIADCNQMCSPLSANLATTADRLNLPFRIELERTLIECLEIPGVNAVAIGQVAKIKCNDQMETLTVTPGTALAQGMEATIVCREGGWFATEPVPPLEMDMAIITATCA